VKLITLTQDKFAQVDDADFDALNRFNWQAVQQNGRWYAVRQETRNGKHFNIRMHREIVGAPRLVPVRFEDGDSLNCQRSNLSLSRKRRPARSQHSTTDERAVPQTTKAGPEAIPATPPYQWLRRITRSLFRQTHP
jgi:hypothetical protein